MVPKSPHTDRWTGEAVAPGHYPGEVPGEVPRQSGHQVGVRQGEGGGEEEERHQEGHLSLTGTVWRVLINLQGRLASYFKVSCNEL